MSLQVLLKNVDRFGLQIKIYIFANFTCIDKYNEDNILSACVVAHKKYKFGNTLLHAAALALLRRTLSSCRSTTAACKLRVAQSTAALDYVIPPTHTHRHTCACAARRQHI